MCFKPCRRAGGFGCALLLGAAMLLTSCGGTEQSPSSHFLEGTGQLSPSAVGSRVSVSDTSPTSSTTGPETSSAATDSLTQTAAPNEGTSSSKGTSPKTSKTTHKETTTSKGSGTTISRVLNAAALNPIRTNYPELDQQVDAIFAQIFQAGMSTYDKVKACYDYLVKNGTYSHENTAILPVQHILYETAWDRNMAGMAYRMLETHKGVCDHYSAAFMVMTRAIGLESYFVTGMVSKKGGGYTGHAWVNIKIGDVYYVFDPQVQQNNPGAPYYYFGKTDAQMGKAYQYEDREADVRQFHQFRCYPEIAATITVQSSGKTYEASLAQSSLAEESRVFPQGISAESDGTVRIDVEPSGGKGKYRCLIGEGFPMACYADETITGQKSFTLQIKPGTHDLEVVIQNADPSLEGSIGDVIFDFSVSYTPSSDG